MKLHASPKCKLCIAHVLKKRLIYQTWYRKLTRNILSLLQTFLFTELTPFIIRSASCLYLKLEGDLNRIRLMLASDATVLRNC